MDDQTGDGAAAEAGSPLPEAAVPETTGVGDDAGAGGDSGGFGTKECVFCGEWIPSFADRCSHCAGFLPIAEGRAFGQHFFFFVCCLAIFLGALLPWEGAWWDSYGTRSIGGAFLLVFAGYGMVAAFFNIFHRQMIIWPVLLAALDGAYAGWKRVFQLMGSEVAKSIDWAGDLPQKKRALGEFCHLFGPGLWLVVVFSTLFWLVFVVGVVQGGRKAGARKELEKAARAAKRKGGSI